ncbi:hypothetical protein LTR74_004304 [Friedmanniomyces endolithicus]|nr:hypothetical protein LTR74_004304 [Friedmanniomyces endolithicus]
MPTRTLIAQGELCGREWFRTGCLSCRAAIAESNQHGAAADSYVVDLQNDGSSASYQESLRAIAESEGQKRDA